MDPKIRNGIGAFALMAVLAIGAFCYSSPTALIISGALACIIGVTLTACHYARPKPLPQKRTPSSPNVLANGAPVPTSRPRQASFREKQWSALQDALKTSAPNESRNSAGPTYARKTLPLKDPAGGSNLQQRLLKSQDELGVLIARSRKRVDESEQWVQNNVGQVQKEGLEALFLAKAIIEALQKRFDETHALLSASKLDLAKANELLDSALAIQEDTVNRVSSRKSLRPLKPDEWEPTLSVLFKQISRKKSYFRNLPQRPSSPK